MIYSHLLSGEETDGKLTYGIFNKNSCPFNGKYSLSILISSSAFNGKLKYWYWLLQTAPSAPAPRGEFPRLATKLESHSRAGASNRPARDTWEGKRAWYPEIQGNLSDLVADVRWVFGDFRGDMIYFNHNSMDVHDVFELWGCGFPWKQKKLGWNSQKRQREKPKTGGIGPVKWQVWTGMSTTNSIWTWSPVSLSVWLCSENVRGLLRTILCIFESPWIFNMFRAKRMGSDSHRRQTKVATEGRNIHL